MTNQTTGAHRAIALFITIAAGLVAASCTTQSEAPHAAANAQPRMATYQCGEGGNIRIESSGANVVLSENDEAQYQLVAAPPNQRSRYGGAGLALVVEGREALWMRAGKPPLTCRR